MAHYDWATCPGPVHTQIQTFCKQAQIILSDELVSIYLHGSLAMGCFNPEQSDIDLLVVTRQRMSIETKRQLMDLLLRLSNAPCPIEVSFLVAPDIHPFRHPLPYDLHYSESWRQKMSNELANGSWQNWNVVRGHDSDLAAHLTIIHRRGITLYGSAAASVLPPVPDQDYTTSIIEDYVDARDTRMKKPVYFVLNTCRVYAYLSEKQIFSKDEGGVYALETLPTEFHTLIRQALAIYRGQYSAVPFEESVLAGFAAFMDRLFLPQ